MSEISTPAKVALTVGIGILAVPGLVVEPGPFSETAALAAVMAVWGIDNDK